MRSQCSPVQPASHRHLAVMQRPAPLQSASVLQPGSKGGGGAGCGDGGAGGGIAEAPVTQSAQWIGSVARVLSQQTSGFTHRKALHAATPLQREQHASALAALRPRRRR